MQPNEPQYSMEYLDSIATKPPVKTLNPIALWGAIGGVLLAALFLVIVVLSFSGNKSDGLTTVGAKIAALKEVSADSQAKLQSSNLRTLNSSMTLVLTNANRDLTEPLAKQKIKLTDAKNTTVMKVTNEKDEMSATLEDARLNAVFDRTYAREVAFYLKTLRSDMSELYDSTKNKTLKSTLQEIDKNIATLQSSFATFNAG